MVDFIITDFESVRGGGNIVDTVPSAEDFIVDNCTISSSSSGVFVLTPGESLVGTVSLFANKTSITVGESVVFTATVEDTDGEPLEDLTVSFYRDGVSLGSGVSDDTGMVQLTVSSWSVGSFTCTASCQGVSSSGITVTVSKITSTISLSAVSSTISVGDSPQLTGTLSVGSGESVKIYLGDVLSDTVTTGTNGAFSFTGSATSTSGSLTFKAVYDGDSTHSSVTSSNVVITVSGSTPVVTSVSLTSDKSILSYADSESAVLSATVLDDSSNPMSGETVTFYKGSTSIGTATTNSSGIATKSYSATGAGDVTFKATCESIDSSTITVEDCYYANLTEQTITNSSLTVYSAMATGLETLMSGKWQLEFDMMSVSGYDGDLNIGAKSQYTPPSSANYRLSIGMDENKIHFNNRTNSSSNTSQSSTRSRNTYYTLKLVRDGTSVVAYSNGAQFTSKTVNWLGNYNEYDLYWIGWSNCNVKLKNIKFKKVS